jgi:outer membrane receptor protein involved in Fe transport
MARRLFVSLVVLLFTAYLGAQTFRGSIQGTVTDSSGASVSGAQVKVVSAETGLTRTVTTSDDGNYSAAELPPGLYSVTFTKAGFKSATLKGVDVSVSTVARANISLTPGEVKESVEVNADVPLVETSSNIMGGTIEGKEASELPVNGRDFTKLLVLVPGATGDPVGASDSPGSFGLFSVNGNRGRSNNYLLDGTDMNDGFRNLPSINEAGVFGTPATILPVDALAEVPVISGGEAEYGRNSGAIVNLVTKSGTNKVHGSLFGSLRDNRFDARNYFNPTTDPQDRFHNDQFGISAGGPIVKDKTFWYAAYEGQREHGALPSPGTIPTQADIAAATPEGGINPVIAGILATNPWGTLPAGPDTGGNGVPVTFSVPFYNRVDSFIGKIDQHLGKADLLTGRYFFGDSVQAFPLGLVAGGTGTPKFDTVTPTRVNVLSLSYTKVLTPALLLEIRSGYNRFSETFSAQDSNFNPASIQLATLGAGTNSRDFGMPLINVSGFSKFGSNAANPRGRTDNNYQLFGNMTYTKGNHNWKWGYEWRRTAIDGFFDNGYRGVLSFGSLSDFLGGIPSGGRSAQGVSARSTHENSSGLYLQDSWRFTTRLTLNFGLRWDYYGVIGADNNAFSILNKTTDSLTHPAQLYPKDLNNFAPRLSLAYDLTGKGKTLIRAGWGVFYDAFSQDFFVGQLPFNTFNAGPAYNDIQFSFSPVAQIQPNVPVFTGYAATDVFTVDQNLRTPYVQNYNVNIEHQITSGLALQVGYVGSAGRKLFRYRDINQVNPATGTQAFPNFVYVNQFETSASSSYNSLQTSLRLRNLHGITSTLNYTWGHSIDNASDGQDYVPNATQPDNSFNPAAERASSNFDTRHRLQWYWSYDVPKFGGPEKLSKGWMLDGVVVYSTGQPYNINYLFEGDYNGSGEFFGRPDLIGNPFAGTSTPAGVLNLAAFAAPCTWSNTDPNTGSCVGGSQHFGNVGRNAYRGPNYANFDFSLVKNTPLAEHLRMQMRVDFFNILNHPNFSNPLLPNFGVDMFNNGSQVVTANGVNRLVGTGLLPITATPDVGTGNPFLGGGGPRNIQFGLRFEF